MKKGKIFIVIIVGVILLSYLIFNNNKSSDYESTDFVYYEFFDTVITIKVYDKVDDDLDAKLKNRLSSIHNASNNFENSEDGIYALNKTNSIDSTYDINEVITTSIDIYNKVSNQFNIALGPVVNVWKDYMSKCNDFRECSVPSATELEFDDELLDPNNIVIENNKITTKPGMIIDLGAIAKGYAADEIAKLLIENGYDHYLIDAGGNILVSTKPDGSTFSIGITNPNDPSSVFTTLNVKNKAIVTSGDYERYYEVDGVRYHHLINNDTHYPSNYFKSVTIITDSSMTADAYSTLFFNNSYEEGEKIYSELSSLDIIWYDINDSIIKTPGVNKYEED